MTLQELEYFYDLAQTLNFSATAERLYVTQPVVSKHIRLLEESLGFLLIDRSIRKRIRLTKSGEMLFRCLQECRSSWTNTLDQIKNALDISQIKYYLPEDQILPRDILEKFNVFRVQSSQNSPVFKVFDRNSVKEDLSDGGFIIVPDFLKIAGNHHSLRIHTAAKDTLQLISSASHPAANKGLSAYAGSPLFLPAYYSQDVCSYMSKIYFSTFGVTPEILILDSPVTIMMYLQADIGVTINTSWYAWLKDPRLVSAPLNKTVTYRIIWDSETYHPEQALKMARSLSVVR